AAWEKRSERVRRQILLSQGLWPMPTKTPLNPVIHGKIDRGEYTVEKVYFESAPGFFVTGNLYRPKNVAGKAPGVLFAHGHWADARLSESTDAELRRELADGEERFEQGGRSRFQSMCVQLARMGCVVWQWDMLGNSDSQQLSRNLVHGFKKQRPEMNTTENWGLFSPQAEAHLQSAMGLQTWNSIRSLDFLLSLPEVDPDRIAMTGASGGGTQTMILGAPDEVMLHRGEHFPHNYNAVSRSAFYTWLNRHFKLGLREPVIERDYRRLTRDDLTVWDAEHPKPPAGPDFERKLLRWFSD